MTRRLLGNAAGEFSVSRFHRDLKSQGVAVAKDTLHALLRRDLAVAYVRTEDGCEVDFLARDHEGNTQLIQACADADEPATLEREVRALEAAAAEYPDAGLHLVTLRPESVREVPAGVSVHSAAVWLLGG